MIYTIENTLNYEAIKELGEIDLDQEHEFDLSKVTFVTPDGIIPLRLILYKISSKYNKKIKVIVPSLRSEKYDVYQYLEYINFFNNIRVTLLNAEGEILSARRLISDTPQNPNHTHLIDSYSYKIDSEMEILISVIINFLKKHHFINGESENKYRGIFDETFQNLREHSSLISKSPSYFCAQAQIYQKHPSQLILSIGDCGVGIRNSLNTVFDYQEDVEAIKATVEERKSRIVRDVEKGGGIRFIFDKCKEMDFNCRLKSGDAEVLLSNGARRFKYYSTSHFPGTQLFLWN
ncbi:MAG TPA: hypothetical protein VE912_03855 [Bacteroidales bacterium]|nr:hypothetical protein [Bacteroidales bacterium]